MRWRWPDAIGLILAIGLVVSPWLIGLSGAAAISIWTVGGAAIVVFALALPRPGQTKGWLNLALAIALLVAPFVLGFTSSPDPLWTHWLAGVLLGIAALWSLARTGADVHGEDTRTPQ